MNIEYIIAEYVFTPKKRSRQAQTSFRETVQSFAYQLHKNGQICGEEVTYWVDGTLRVVCYVPYPDALSTEYCSREGQHFYQKVLKLCLAEPFYRIVDNRSPASTKVIRWQSEGALYLGTGYFSTFSPVRSGKKGVAIPLYQLPLDDTLKDLIYSWELAYKATDYLWIDSGEPEIPAYREMADPHSALSQRGRALCESIEDFTNLPTYYYLDRYWGRREGEADRVCPNCGKLWANPRKGSHRALGRFDFLCQPCRLISNLAVSFEDERHARIGEYKVHRSPTSLEGIEHEQSSH